MTLPTATNDWTLRTEILEIAHRWPQVFIAFLLGSLLGWGAALIFPTSYRAQTEIYVAYNADAIYRNPDDYKNWQFEELDAYIVSNDVLSETMQRLRQQDPYWQDIKIKDVKPNLRTFWRSAGRWRLVADWSDQQHATQLSQTWTEVILEKTSQAATHAQAVLDLEAQIAAHSKDEVNVRLQFTQLTQLKNALETWRQAQDPAGNQPLDTLARWRLQFLAASIASQVPVDLALLAEFPAQGDPASAYFPAIDQAIIALDESVAVVERQLTDLTAQREALLEQWKIESQASHNLTAHLTIEPISVENRSARPVRSTSQMALVGGSLGLLLWALVWLARPLYKAGR